MKFQLHTTRSVYHDLDEVDRLRKLGIEFDPPRKATSSYIMGDGNYRVDTVYDKNTKGPPAEIEFNTIEELVAFLDKWGGLVLELQLYTRSGKKLDTPIYRVEIYDDYRE